MSLISLTISTCQRFPFFDILRLDEPCGVRPRRLLGQSRLRHSTEADDACGLRRECHTLSHATVRYAGTKRFRVC